MSEVFHITLILTILLLALFGAVTAVNSICNMFVEHKNKKLGVVPTDPYNGLMKAKELCILDDEDMLKAQRFIEYRDKQNSIVESIQEDIQENQNDLVKYITNKYGLKKFRINLDCVPLIEVTQRIKNR